MEQEFPTAVKKMKGTTLFRKNSYTKKEQPAKCRKELDASIIYAKRIQEGMMLKEKHLSRLFSKSFIFFEPKDIVSGDFYWFTKIEDKIIVAAADCTGHGVPGAFMSVLGISLMNQIVIEERNTDTSLILQRLDHKLKKAFGYSHDFIEDEKLPYDGMDIALCCIDYKLKTITYSGAQRPVFLLSSDTFKHIDGSRYPIGGANMEPARRYESKTAHFNAGDQLYLCTDGFADQFGGILNKKFMNRNFKELLWEVSKLPMELQLLQLQEAFNGWKGASEQTDDVLVLGLTL